MSVIYILIIISLLLAGVFLVSFFQAIRQGQFDDDHTPGIRVLFEDEVIKNKQK